MPCMELEAKQIKYLIVIEGLRWLESGIGLGEIRYETENKF